MINGRRGLGRLLRRFRGHRGLIGHNGLVMIGFALLAFPFLLLGFVLLMGRVEEPLNQVAVERDIEQFLDDASPEELDTFIREGTDSALSRFRARLGIGRLRRGWRRSDD
jgi:hypothetical protein